MTTINQAREAIYQKFVDDWAALTPHTFENEKFEPPQQAVWVRVSVRNTGSAQDTLGQVTNRKYLRRGSVFIQIFAPLNKGVKETDTIAQAARTIFEGLSLTEAKFNNSVFREIGPDDEWYQSTVETFFFYEETK